MEAGDFTDWSKIPFLPINIKFQSFYADFDTLTGEWKKQGIVESHESPEVRQINEEIENLRTKNDILLDMLTVKDLDLIEAQKLKKELEDLVARSNN